MPIVCVTKYLKIILVDSCIFILFFLFHFFSENQNKMCIVNSSCYIGWQPWDLDKPVISCWWAHTDVQPSPVSLWKKSLTHLMDTEMVSKPKVDTISENKLSLKNESSNNSNMWHDQEEWVWCHRYCFLNIVFSVNKIVISL